MSLLQRKSGPFSTLPSLFHGFFEGDDAFGRYFASRDLTPAVNVLEDDGYFEIDVAAPGLKREDFDVSLKDGQLFVAAEKKSEEQEKKDNYMRREFSYSSFNRVFSLPENVKQDDVAARYEDGILRIRLSKAEAAPRPTPKKIAIQ